jgi:hypothetical protein
LEAETIPDDIKRLANEAVYGDGGWHKVGEVVAVARAILAERERCAAVAREESCGACRVLDSFAQAIRKGA